jgi:hypothetical protein
MEYDAYGNPIKPPRGSGALVPLLLILLASLGGNYWLWKERSKSAADANAATAKLAAAEALQKETSQKLEMQEAERAQLIEAKEQAIKDAQARATELAKLKDDVAGVEVTKEPEEEAPADKAKSGAKGKETPAKTDKKTDSKSKTKAKAKKKAVEASRKKDSAGSSKPPAEREL